MNLHPPLRRLSAASLLLAAVVVSAAADPAPDAGYRRAPEAIRQVLDAPATPAVSLSPARDRLLLAQPLRYPPLAELAEPMLALAGTRFNPRNRGPHRPPSYAALTLRTLPDGRETKIKLPAGSRVGLPVWSADGRRFAFARYTETSVELWTGDAATGAVRPQRGVALNAAFGNPFEWMPDNLTLLCRLVPARRGAPPTDHGVPASPVMQETSGQRSRIRTYQDLLQNPLDEARYDYYAAAQLALVNARNGRVTRVGAPANFAAVDPSPDGQHFLITRIVRPYSYLLPAARFPREVEIWDRAGRVVHPKNGS
ncbi:MAG: TolB family protein [Limisphaerales bacterium]